MNISYTSFFFGFLLIIIAFAFIVRIIFKIKIPVFKLILALIFLIVGFKLISYSIPALRTDNFAIFDKKNFKDYKYKNLYITTFSQTKLNLRNVSFQNDISEITIINFGSDFTLYYDNNYPTKLKITNVLSHTETPKEDLNTFGKITIYTSTYDRMQKHLSIKVITIFGNTYLRWTNA